MDNAIVPTVFSPWQAMIAAETALSSGTDLAQAERRVRDALGRSAHGDQGLIRALASLILAQGRTAEALSIIVAAGQLHPDNRLLTAMEAFARHRLGHDTTEVMASLAGKQLGPIGKTYVHEVPPVKARPHYREQAYEAMDRDDPATAYHVLKPHTGCMHPRLLALFAKAAYRTGRLAEAREAMHHVREHLPHEPKIMETWLLIERETGTPKELSSAAHEAAAHAGDSSHVLREAAINLLHSRADSAAALSYAAKAYRLSRVVHTAQTLAWALVANGDVDRARDVLQDHEPQKLEVEARLALLHLDVGRTEEAVAIAATAAAEFPERARAHAAYGRTLVRLGDFKGARAAFDTALDINPEHAGTWLAISDLYAAEHQYASAAEAFIRAVDYSNEPKPDSYNVAKIASIYLDGSRDPDLDPATRSQHLATAESYAQKAIAIDAACPKARRVVLELEGLFHELTR